MLSVHQETVTMVKGNLNLRMEILILDHGKTENLTELGLMNSRMEIVMLESLKTENSMETELILGKTSQNIKVIG